MHNKLWRLVAALTAIAVVAGGGAALAAGNSPASKRGAVASAVAIYLGLSRQQLRADLATGQTLAQIASAEGKSVLGLEQTIEAAVKTRLDQAVAAGKITAGREQLILSKLPARVDKLVNTAQPGALVGAHLRLQALVRASAAYLGLTPVQLRTDLRTGRTLAQVATVQGKTTAGLEQAIGSAVKSRLDKAVAAGRITASREQQILAGLPARLDKLVNRSFARAYRASSP